MTSSHKTLSRITIVIGGIALGTAVMAGGTSAASAAPSDAPPTEAAPASQHVGRNSPICGGDAVQVSHLNILPPTYWVFSRQSDGDYVGELFAYQAKYGTIKSATYTFNC